MNEVQVKTTSISTDVLTTGQLQLFKNGIAVVDRNPVIHWKRGELDHNEDFCVIEGSIEITRNFALKIMHLAKFNLSIRDPIVTDKGIIIVGKVWNDESSTEETGACNFSEIKGKRPLHDATTKATTRMLKRAIEVKAGLPFINLMIKEIFGGFQTENSKADKERNVTPEAERNVTTDPVQGETTPGKEIKLEDKNWFKQLPPDCRELVSLLRTIMEDSVGQKIMLPKTAEIWWRRIKTNCQMVTVLRNIYTELSDLIEKWQKEKADERNT